MYIYLEGEGGNKALDLGALGDGLPLLVLKLAGNGVLGHIVLLPEVEELADVVRALGTQAAGDLAVGQAGDVLFFCCRECVCVCEREKEDG